jgi:hypothetical protein
MLDCRFQTAEFRLRGLQRGFGVGAFYSLSSENLHSEICNQLIVKVIISLVSASKSLKSKTSTGEWL